MINCLPKTKSGTRNRHNHLASAEDHTPATHTGNGTPSAGDVDEEESGDVVPRCYRWISNLKPAPDAPSGDKIFLSFSVPTLLLPVPHQPALDGDRDAGMVAPEQQWQRQQSKSLAPAVCDVDGCTATRT
ncbi:hypothetical protein BC827DRAFT_755699 [Russula dissimulans]|nr:hypothetical protein BC827DRAFT_755699 [Russula dissimulans]